MRNANTLNNQQKFLFENYGSANALQDDRVLEALVAQAAQTESLPDLYNQIVSVRERTAQLLHRIERYVTH